MSLLVFSPRLFGACLLVTLAFLATYFQQPEESERDLTAADGVSLMQHAIVVKQVIQPSNFSFISEDAAISVADYQASAATIAETLWSFDWNPQNVHPFPSWNWSDIKTGPAIVCCIVLFFGAILCSAGGIGGGGIYVTVLMVAGQLSPRDAVPLSKAVVFFGSLVSLVLNVRKALVMQEESSKATLINYNICRLVVPMALLGTLIGVMVNSIVPSWLIVTLLVLILIGMTFMSFRKFYGDYSKEALEAKEEAQQPDGQSANQNSGSADVAKAIAESGEASIRGILLRGEGFGSFFLLILIIVCGVFRQHLENCKDAINLAMVQDAVPNTAGLASCQRPIMTTFFGQAVASWMAQPVLRDYLPMIGVALPAIACVLISFMYSRYLVKEEGWNLKEVGGYSIMALLTGCFAGLVGIGGGLVFSPFMLFMGVHSSIAVATSSTCVIFTSSSTTMQYLLTDRIMLSLAILYGVVAAIASYIGTSAVHMLQDKFQARQSYISGVVCLGVLASVILSVYKLAAIGITPH